MESFINKYAGIKLHGTEVPRKERKMAYVMDLKKMCQRCGKKRVIEIGDALYVARVGKAVAQREFCFCG